MTRQNLRTFRTLAIAGAAIGLLGCAAEVTTEPQADGDLEVNESPLAYPPGVRLFTDDNKEVAVCFFDYLVPAADYAVAKRTVRFAIEGSWGLVSGLRFTGWGDCPNAPGSNVVTIQLEKEGYGVPPDPFASVRGGVTQPGKGARLPSSPFFSIPVAGMVQNFIQMRIAAEANAADLGWLAIHEMGHALGLSHEQNRNDVGTDCPPSVPQVTPCISDASCNAVICDPTHPCSMGAPCVGPAGGVGLCSTSVCDFNRPIAFFGTCVDSQSVIDPNLNLVTPYDPDSVMNYCGPRPNGLTAWDIYGIRAMYGERTPYFKQLVTAYSSALKDSATAGTGSLGSFNGLIFGGYKPTFVEGWIASNELPTTIPLRLYYNDKRGDYVLVATTATLNEVVDAGYRFMRTEGFAYSAASSVPGTGALNLFWNKDLHHYLMTATTAGAAAATAAGYVPRRTEAKIFMGVPYDIVSAYWDSSRKDNLMTRQGSVRAREAVDRNSVYLGTDGLVMRDNVPGTTPAIRQYWSAARNDHFATATTAGFNAAIAAGYTQQPDEGYAFSAQAAAMKPLETYWNSDRQDNFTTIDRGASARSASYTFIRTEGYLYPVGP